MQRMLLARLRCLPGDRIASSEKLVRVKIEILEAHGKEGRMGRKLM